MRRRGEEVFRLPAGPAGPFGEPPVPWWRRLLSTSQAAPKQYTIPVGLASGFVVLVAGSGAHGLAKLLILPFAAGIPVVFVDWWWRTRTRREQERLLPEDQLGGGS